MLTKIATSKKEDVLISIHIEHHGPTLHEITMHLACVTKTKNVPAQNIIKCKWQLQRGCLFKTWTEMNVQKRKRL